jgi:predicted lipoprotein
MAPRNDADDLGHRAVMSNLHDLQARLRGDPASLVLPRDGRRNADAVTVTNDDVAVTTEPDESPHDPASRIQALRRKLEFLELEIDAYENAADASATSPSPPPAEADVVGLQHTVEERLAEH